MQPPIIFTYSRKKDRAAGAVKKGQQACHKKYRIDPALAAANAVVFAGEPKQKPGVVNIDSRRGRKRTGDNANLSNKKSSSQEPSQALTSPAPSKRFSHFNA